MSLWNNTPERPLSDFSPSLLQNDAAERVMSRDECEALFDRILGLTKGGGHTSVSIDGRWTGNLRWARNRVTTSGDTRNIVVRIVRSINGARGEMGTNKIDDDSLRLAIEGAERLVLYNREDLDAVPMPKEQRYLNPDVWSDKTYNLTARDRSSTARDLVSPAAEQSLLSAGYVQVEAFSNAIFNTMGMNAYYPSTRAEYSVTVRDPARSASGWAGVDQRDWELINAQEISERAMQKCIDSADPQVIEPGRYTTIFEAQATHDLFVSAIRSLDRYAAELFNTVYTLSPGQSKIGETMMDKRIVVSTDPMDPDAGYVPFDSDGYPFKPTTWIENGVLRELAYGRSYALSQLGHGIPQPNPGAYRMNGGTATIEEMISGTARGLLVTRLNNVTVLNGTTLMSTGTTRDGLWLIERGQIKHAVKNFRFTDSPMFALNNLEQMGVPTKVLAPYPAVVPPIKVQDFNFSSLADAI